MLADEEYMAIIIGVISVERANVLVLSICCQSY